MIKLIAIIIIGYFAVMIARILFRMFIRKITRNLTNPGQSAGNDNTSRNNIPKEPKKKFYDPNKIEDAKFEELK
ncbi:hypothetical protein BH10BAC5_BH10BAC5_23120 [soil metagenome]